MPFGPFDSFADCVSKSGDKGNAEAYCAWLHHELTGQWPAEASQFPPDRLAILDSTMGQALHDFKFQALETRSVNGIEVFSVGTWTDSKGAVHEWTADALRHMANAFKPQSIALKVGHTSPEFNCKVAAALGVPSELLTGDRQGKGQIALGFASRLRFEGGKLIADFEGVPAPLADLIAGGQYCSVSSEIEFTTADKPLLTGVALLGVEQPAVENLAGLAAAEVFQARDKARVYTFQKGGTVADKLTTGSSIKDILALFQEGNGDALTAIAVALGLDPTKATLSDVLKAIEAMKTGGAGGAAMPEEMKAEHSKLKTESSALQSKVESQATTIATFEHERRLARYQKLADGWQAIPGKAEELAAQLADTEEKAGEKVAQLVVAQFQAANKVAEAAGILRPIGRAKQSDGTSPAEAKLKEFESAGLSHEKAVVKLSKERPDLFRAYQVENLINVGGNGNGE